MTGRHHAHRPTYLRKKKKGGWRGVDGHPAPHSSKGQGLTRRGTPGPMPQERGKGRKGKG